MKIFENPFFIKKGWVRNTIRYPARLLVLKYVLNDYSGCLDETTLNYVTGYHRPEVTQTYGAGLKPQLKALRVVRIPVRTCTLSTYDTITLNPGLHE